MVVVLAVALSGAASAQSTAVEPQARELLVKALNYISRQERFSVVVRANYDSYQQSGQKIEFGETRKVTLIRPDRLRVDIEESNGVGHVMLFDGKDLTLSTPQSHVYAQLPKPGTIDQAVVFFVRDLRMRLPLAALLVTTATDELTQRTCRSTTSRRPASWASPRITLPVERRASTTNSGLPTASNRC